MAQGESQHLCEVNYRDIGGETCCLGCLSLIDVENGVREVAGADDDIRTLMLGLGQNSSRLTEHSWFF